MRLIRITTNYPSYLKQFYAQRPELFQETYAVQYKALMADCYSWADFWTHGFGKLGYEVWEPVGNAEPMQKAWARENGVSYRKKTWLTDIVTAQVKHFQPDVVFVNDYLTYTAEFFHHLRSECPSIRLVIGWCGAPYPDGSVFKAYDLVLSNIPSLVTHFRANGHRCEYMCHAFEPRILDKINSQSAPTTAFSFVGSIIKGSGFHHQREQLLKKLVQETELQIWSDICQPSEQERQLLPLKQKVYDLVQTAKSIPGGKSLLTAIPKIKKYVSMEHRPDMSDYVDPAIATRSKPALFGISMYQKLYESQVTLNTHIDLSARFASNMRLYEATGVGTCLLTDWQANLREVFETDVEVVTYRSAEEAMEKVWYLLEHEEERRAIARAGQARTLSDHTYAQRAIQLDEIIRQELKSR
ncbi:MAG: glycosyltransferase [Xenococcaceae cyanobacterium]